VLNRKVRVKNPQLLIATTVTCKLKIQRANSTFIFFQTLKANARKIKELFLPLRSPISRKKITEKVSKKFYYICQIMTSLNIQVK
jgi:hypothetical protein